MKKTYTVHTDAGGLRIELSPRKPPVIIFGLTLMAVIYFASAIWGTGEMKGLNFSSSSRVGGLVMTAYMVVFYLILYILVARAFVRRLSHHQTITVRAGTLTIRDRFILGSRERSFDLKHIDDIFFAGTEDFTPHPLDGYYGDIGFRGMEALVHYQITDGNIMLLYSGRRIRFGRDIPSWDAEEITRCISEYTGKVFTPPVSEDTGYHSAKASTKFSGKME